MSQICRYYLKGICKYGSRCHFLHESYDSSYKENYSGYSNSNYQDKYYSSSNSRYNKNTNNYGRYHVDNRSQNSQNQTTAKSTSILTDDEIFDIIQQELREFEERYNWFLTVVAPLKDLDNIPGLNDLSPEELRFQYYESRANNTVQEFVRNLNIARNDVAQICRKFSTRSREAFEIVENMIQKQKMGEMGTSATSTFKFDLNALSKPPVFAPQPVHSEQPIEVSSVHNSVFPSGDFSAAPASNFRVDQSNTSNFQFNSINNFNQPTSAMNSFSFSLNKLQSSQNAPSVFQNSGASSNAPAFSNSNFGTNSFDNPNANPSIFNQPSSSENSHFNSASNVNVFCDPVRVSETADNSIYSKREEIPEEALNAFLEKYFQMGRIPLVAPSKDLC